METEKLGYHAHHDEYRIALFYVYVELRSLEEVVHFHESFRESRLFGGRIRISTEGINGVLSGRLHDLKHYEHGLGSLLCRMTDTYRSIDVLQPWELDVKYCHLRPDLTVESQLFPNWQVQMTNSVVGLMDLRSIGNFDPIQGTDCAKSHHTDSDRGFRQTRRQRRHSVVTNNDFHQLQKYHLATTISLYQKSVLAKVSMKQPLCGAQHLSPVEWNWKLDQLTQQQSGAVQNIVLLDCRNCYESAVGYFQVPNATTLLANTRKYSELPIVLVDQLSKQNSVLRTAGHIFMYCTGGVRCERASVFLQAAISETLSCDLDDKYVHDGATMPHVYQLNGGIQRYLEFSSKNENSSSYFRGKNFVFDLRRTDPTIVRNGMDDKSIVGICLVCEGAHDDYDNGHAPSTNHEARCYRCRILVLVCNRCRPSVVCWGDEIIFGERSECSLDHRPKLYCGGLAPKECLYMPPVAEIRDC
jgi:predicted sulfurtransferase